MQYVSVRQTSLVLLHTTGGVNTPCYMSSMAGFQVNDRLGQTERYYTERDAMASFPSRIGDQAPRKRGYSEPNQIDSENYPVKNSWSYPKFLESPTPSIGVNSNASSENYPRTTNTSMSEEQLENDEALKPGKISHMDRSRSHYHADDHPTAPNLPTRPVSNEGMLIALVIFAPWAIIQPPRVLY